MTTFRQGNEKPVHHMALTQGKMSKKTLPVGGRSKLGSVLNPRLPVNSLTLKKCDNLIDFDDHYPIEGGKHSEYQRNEKLDSALLSELMDLDIEEIKGVEKMVIDNLDPEPEPQVEETRRSRRVTPARKSDSSNPLINFSTMLDEPLNKKVSKQKSESKIRELEIESWLCQKKAGRSDIDSKKPAVVVIQGVSAKPRREAPSDSSRDDKMDQVQARPHPGTPSSKKGSNYGKISQLKTLLKGKSAPPVSTGFHPLKPVGGWETYSESKDKEILMRPKKTSKYPLEPYVEGIVELKLALWDSPWAEAAAKQEKEADLLSSDPPAFQETYTRAEITTNPTLTTNPWLNDVDEDPEPTRQGIQEPVSTSSEPQEVPEPVSIPTEPEEDNKPATQIEPCADLVPNFSLSYNPWDAEEPKERRYGPQ